MQIMLAETGDISSPPEKGVSECYDYTVAVDNVGTGPCYVRVAAVFPNESIANHATMNIDDEHWHYESCGDDALYGYFYCDELLEAGAESPLLIDGIDISASFTEGDENTWDILIYAEGISGEAGSDYLEAWNNAGVLF